MKIIWLTNIRLPIIDNILGFNTKTHSGGWLTGLSMELLGKENLELMVCYPETDSKFEISGKKNNFSYYGFPIKSKEVRIGKLDIKSLIERFTKLLKEEKPDIVHIHGTEFQFSYAMAVAAKNCNLLDSTIVSIQGLVSVYANHFFGNLPRDIKIPKTLKEWIISDGINNRHRSFLRRGKYEVETLKTVKHVMGRTNWDKACTHFINQQLEYHFCNETLRSDFYSGLWDYNHCEPNSIFVSQAGTPIKGVHIMISAINEVKKYYPNVKVNIAGPNITEGNFLIGNSYGLYIKKSLKKFNLETTINFLGPLDSKNMKEQLLKSNIFVSSSSIENSPNSLGEAMLLGVPCISSNVGGVIDMMKHETEGYIFPADESYMLAYYIMKVFKSKEKISEISYKARERALVTHDPRYNLNALLEIYSRLNINSVNLAIR